MKTNTHFRTHIKRNLLSTSISEQIVFQTELVKKKKVTVRAAVHILL